MKRKKTLKGNRKMERNDAIPQAEETLNAELPQEEAAQEETCTLSLEERLAKAEQEKEEYLEMAARIKAEFDNYRRRTGAVRSEAWEDGARETVALMLPVIDNLERAIAAEKEKTPMRDGVEMVLRQMLDALEKRGVTPIDRLGEPFDPELENAVAQADVSEGEPGTIATVLQKGYKTQNRVIRHAMVRVVAST